LFGSEPLRYVVGSVIVTVGAPVSINHVSLAGVPSALPAASIACTSNVWLPSASAGEIVCGLVQEAQALPSMRHSKLEPLSLELNANVGVVFADGLEGLESIVVLGAVRSTVQV
jgi:hypothetical protein